ncbi:MAG TPA: formylglycine-generating enzyme family protein [Candidatus Competibacter sp.]|nr:formylglycine-generating enzyme family protein [Candidatus Competibacter sp.]
MPLQGACGWADLVRALEVGGPALMADMAALLGFEARSRILLETRVDIAMTASATLTIEPPPEPLVESKPLLDVSFWRLEKVEFLEPSKPLESPIEPAAALPEWVERPPVAIPQPLARWPELLPRLRRALARSVESHELDVVAIVQRIGQGENLRRLPRRACRHWGATLHVIEDRSERLTPYWRDQALVRQQLFRLLPRHAVRHALIDEGLEQPIFVGLPCGVDRRYRSPPPGGWVLVLGDLGGLARDDSRMSASWKRLGRGLTDAGCQAVALLPQPTTWCSPSVRRYWRLLSWERGPSAPDPEHCARQLELLLWLLAPTARVEPGLLRDLRRLAGLEATVESLVWQHPAVASTSSVAATLDPEALKCWRASFEAQPEPLRIQVVDRLRAWRARLPGEVYLGEAALLDAGSQALLPARERVLCHDFFAALDAQVRGVGGAIAPRGAEEWFLRFEQRSTKQEAIWRTAPLHRLWEAVHRCDEGALQPPPGFKPETIESDPSRPAKAITIRQQGDDLIFSPEIETAIEPHLGSLLGNIKTHNGLIQVEPLSIDPADRNAFWKSGRPPSWVDDWGTDEYGHWATFSVENRQGQKITQKMRWIKPGTFLMGSPENELARWDTEGPQHSVTIRQGFWLFNTACTQALWEAVTGGDSTQLEDADSPVDRVTWNGCQTFMNRLNERLSGLDLTLPSEAQWEYACRAGTATPFSFGTNITPEQVNYDGNYPYVSGNKGRYRQKAVPVASLPPNPWGLYEMHGNVWEWCQDHWHDNYQGAPTDGSAWEDYDTAGADRVLRGGSWDRKARNVRSVSRLHIDPGYRFDGIGLRCARVQSGAEPSIQPDLGQLGGATGASPALLRLDTGESPARCLLPQAPTFLVNTDRERLTFHRLVKPAWASAIGRDRFGLWCEIEIDPGRGEPVVQRLRWIPPGRFWMGSSEEETRRLAKDDYERKWFKREHPRHPVTLTEGCWLSDTPCTQALWEAVMGENPSRFISPNRPVESVSWHDVQDFLKRLNGRIPGLDLTLPSEAQWEYACRAGTETAIYTGALDILGENNAPVLDPIAWYGGNSGVEFELHNGVDSSNWPEKQYPHTRAGTQPVKLKRANPWGLHDMLGNVWEWCQDGMRDYDQDVSIPTGSLEAVADRVLRGGSWYSDARYVRAAYRNHALSGNRFDGIGFRCTRK